MTKRLRNLEIAHYERNKEFFTNKETLNNIKMNWKQKKVIPIGLIVLVDNNHTKTIRALFCMQQNGKIENVFTNQKNNIYYINDFIIILFLIDMNYLMIIFIDID
jgi:hypothetical protein